MDPRGPTETDLLAHISNGGELNAAQRRKVVHAGHYDSLSLISALEVADIVIAEDLDILSEAMVEGLIAPQWLDQWFARKRRQVEGQDLLRLKLVRAERLAALSRALWS